ncbi:polysaccharide biosynthesis tyrosine autokinase [Thauera sp.]|uniref:GumC family protein n=1 Tax=Thauera sp. TaxID=1905334 RepID=UPI00257E98B9|nr:polysaccharide biosynthesis tyrosine autokinase [Thauera sp.]
MTSESKPVALAPANRFTTKPDDEGVGFDLLGVVRTLWARKWSILFLVLIVSMAATLWALSLTPIYRAQATLLIEPRSSRVMSIEQIYGVEGSGGEFLQTQVELLQSRGLAERVVRELDLINHPAFQPAADAASRWTLPSPSAMVAWAREKLDLLPLTLPEEIAPVEPPSEIDAMVARRDAIARALMGAIRVERLRGTQVVGVAVEMADARLAARVANAVTRGYIDSQLEARMAMSMSATTWMNERLEELRTSLRQAEDALQRFREGQDLVDVQGVATVATSELSMTGTRLNEAQRKRAEMENEYRQIQSARASGFDALLAVPTLLYNPLVQQAATAESKARAKVDELAQRYGPRHPTMEAAAGELERARGSLREQLNQVVASIERNYQLAVANERALSSAFNATKSEIQDISRKEFRLRELQREVDANRALYDTFLGRLKETNATSDLEPANARIVDQAVAPDTPVRPRKSMIVGGAALAALALGIGMALLLEKLNNTFKSTEDVENALNLPVLGILPRVKTRDRSESLALFGSPKHKSFAESVRTVRTGLLLALRERKHVRVVVTSAVPGEGKTTAAANLAMALGQLGRVLLVEADMRRPTMARAFGLPPGSPGLANLLADTATIKDALHHLDGFDLIPAGTVPPDPLKLIATPLFEELIALLTKGYDYVIIDTPPTQAVSDAVVLASAADAVIYVVKSDNTPIPVVSKGVGQLLQNHAVLSGVVLNQVDVARAQRYGYRYGGYYDYYGYHGSKS